MSTEVQNTTSSQHDAKLLVMPSCLSGHYNQVVCKNKGELHYVLLWAENQNKKVSKWMWDNTKFPIHLFLQDEIVGWTDSTNRIGDKILFSDFVSSVNWA